MPNISRKLESFSPYFFLAPALVGLLVFRLFPIANALVSSFQTTGFSGIGNVRWVGLENYKFLVQDPTFWQSFKATLLFTLVINPVQICAALILALLVNRDGKAINVFRTIFFMPVTVSTTVASVLWGLMLNPNSGLINSMLAMVGISPQPFLTSSRQAMWSIVALTTWRAAGYWMIFILAGLQQVPTSVYEASTIDGANGLQTFRYITFPLLKRTLTFVVVADTSANFLLFVPMYLLTKGGPAMSTNVLMYEAFRNAFIYGDRGKACAIVVIILLLVLLTVGLEFRLLRSEQ